MTVDPENGLGKFMSMLATSGARAGLETAVAAEHCTCKVVKLGSPFVMHSNGPEIATLPPLRLIVPTD